MKLKIMSLLLLTSLSALAHAEHCPSVKDIKTDTLHAWQPLNINSASPATPEELKTFKEELKKFNLAEYMDSAPEGAAHCYYAGKAGSESQLGVYFAKPNLVPSKNAGWVKVNEHTMQCKASFAQCAFKNKSA